MDTFATRLFSQNASGSAQQTKQRKGERNRGKLFTTIELCQQMRQSKARRFSPSNVRDGDGGVVVTISCKTL